MPDLDWGHVMGDDSMDVGDLGYKALTLDVPLHSGDRGGVVRFSTVDWEGRARAAEDAAVKLNEALKATARVLPNNYFGDCVEGRELYSRSRTALDTWRDSLTRQRDELVALAAQCRAAATELVSADVDGALGIET
ncbi:hypothetical protein [Gordonia bronchialis]|uniref:hypothetical protein n=1 Tax=Gordonia bronchialis TaxID=2054 RepID=UPI00226D51B7|nr:hypothetical protein [Gordonia bronchialis]